MSRPRRKRKISSRGIGHCGSPGCPKNKVPGHFLCFDHLPPVIEVKEQIEQESKERSLFTKQSNSHNQTTNKEQKVKGKSSRTPTCCWIGCLEPRYPGKNYCEFHLDQEEETE